MDFCHSARSGSGKQRARHHDDEHRSDGPFKGERSGKGMLGWQRSLIGRDSKFGEAPISPLWDHRLLIETHPPRPPFGGTFRETIKLKDHLGGVWGRDPAQGLRGSLRAIFETTIFFI